MSGFAASPLRALGRFLLAIILVIGLTVIPPNDMGPCGSHCQDCFEKFECNDCGNGKPVGPFRGFDGNMRYHVSDNRRPRSCGKGERVGIVELLLVGLGLAMDAFAVSVAKGLATGRPTLRQALCAGLWFGGFQACMPLLGWLLGNAVNGFVRDWAPWIAFALLAFIGCNMIREVLTERREGGDSSEENASFGPRAMAPLALATSIDALAAGVDFALLGVDIWLAIGIIGGITLVLSAAGVFFGAILGKRLRTVAQIAGGAVLIIIGLKIILQHLLAG